MLTETTCNEMKQELNANFLQKSNLTVQTYIEIRHFVHMQLSLWNDQFC